MVVCAPAAPECAEETRAARDQTARASFVSTRRASRSEKPPTGRLLARAGRAGRSAKYEERAGANPMCQRTTTLASSSRPRKPQRPGARVGTSERRRQPTRTRATDRRAHTQPQASGLSPKPKPATWTRRLLLARPCVGVGKISLGIASRVEGSD